MLTMTITLIFQIIFSAKDTPMHTTSKNSHPTCLAVCQEENLLDHAKSIWIKMWATDVEKPVTAAWKQVKGELGHLDLDIA